MTSRRQDENGNVWAVELEFIGEGLSGDYQGGDDVPLMRFTVLLNGEQVDDASYCTLIPATTDPYYQRLACEHILAVVYGKPHIKQLCENLSWLDPNDLIALEHLGMMGLFGPREEA